MEYSFEHVDRLNVVGLNFLSTDEQQNINGGIAPFLVAFLAIGGGAAAGVAIYEAGKAVGEFIYNVTH